MCLFCFCSADNLLITVPRLAPLSAHALAHTHTRAHTRTRMLTLARMFARFRFHVSPFALLVLWTPVVLDVSRPC